MAATLAFSPSCWMSFSALWSLTFLMYCSGDVLVAALNAAWKAVEDRS
jgi:hypothetical protein